MSLTVSHMNCSWWSTSSDCLPSPAVRRCARLLVRTLPYISRSHVILSYVCKHCCSSQTPHHTDPTAAVSKLKYESLAVLKRKQRPDQRRRSRLTAPVRGQCGEERFTLIYLIGRGEKNIPRHPYCIYCIDMQHPLGGQWTSPLGCSENIKNHIF